MTRLIPEPDIWKLKELIIINQDLVNGAAEYIREKVPFMPTTGIILGSGLGSLVDSMKQRITLDYNLIPGWPSSTAPGHAGRLVYGILNGAPLLVMQGRVHLYEGYSMKEVTFPIRVLGQLGIGNLILTNASGGIDHGLLPGDLVLIHDHINFMGQNPLMGQNCDNWGPRFPDMTYAYDRKLMDLASKSACDERIQLKKGVYIAFSGPSYETPAEIRMSRILGADVVGMSTVPEVIVANHMGMRVCAISCVANYAAGMTSEKLSEDEVLNEMKRASDKLVRLLGSLVESINRN